MLLFYSNHFHNMQRWTGSKSSSIAGGCLSGPYLLDVAEGESEVLDRPRRRWRDRGGDQARTGSCILWCGVGRGGAGSDI